jgi:hypothetical protein
VELINPTHNLQQKVFGMDHLIQKEL